MVFVASKNRWNRQKHAYSIIQSTLSLFASCSSLLDAQKWDLAAQRDVVSAGERKHTEHSTEVAQTICRNEVSSVRVTRSEWTTSMIKENSQKKTKSVRPQATWRRVGHKHTQMNRVDENGQTRNYFQNRYHKSNGIIFFYSSSSFRCKWDLLARRRSRLPFYLWGWALCKLY